LFFDNAAQNLALPIRLMDRPALNGPACFLDDLGPAVVMDIALTLLLGRLQAPAYRPGVAAPAVDMIVVDDRDNARLRQVEKAPGDHFMAGGPVAFFECKQVVVVGWGIAGKPARRHQ